MTRKILFLVVLVTVALGAFICGRSVGHSEYQDYMLYAEIERAWGMSSLIDLFDEEDFSLFRERTMHIAGLDAVHEAGIVIYPDRFRESLNKSFAIYRQDFGSLDEIRNYTLSLLELRYEKLKEHDWFIGSKFEKRLLENIEALKGKR